VSNINLSEQERNELLSAINNTIKTGVEICNDLNLFAKSNYNHELIKYLINTQSLILTILREKLVT